MCVFLWFILSFFLIVCLSVTVKWLAVKTAPEMTYTVSGGALNSTQSNPICSKQLLLKYSSGYVDFMWFIWWKARYSSHTKNSQNKWQQQRRWKQNVFSAHERRSVSCWCQSAWQNWIVPGCYSSFLWSRSMELTITKCICHLQQLMPAAHSVQVSFYSASA